MSKSKKQIKASTLAYNKRGKAIKAQKAASTGNKRHYADLRLKAKAANERMRQLELADIKSPAYQAAQAKLEILGKPTKGSRGRRFSETGNATYNEYELVSKILDEFLGYETSTLRGAKEYNERIWDAANKNNKLQEAGISRHAWGKFWESLPDKKDRIFGSEQYVSMIRAYSVKNGGLTDEDEYTIEEIAKEIEAQSNLKSAYTAIGITPSEVAAAKIKRGKGAK